MPKRSRRPSIRVGGFIMHDQIRIGDVVRITTVSGDMVSSNTGKVALRRTHGNQVEFSTAQGQILGVYYGNSVDVFRARLIKNAEILDSVTLEGFDALTEVTNGNAQPA
jgi:hypothetical protein